MGIQFVDPGGEYYYSLGMSAPGVWNAPNVAASLVNNAPAGAATQYAIQVVGSASALFDRITANFATLWVGGRFYVGAGGFNGSRSIFQFWDNLSVQCDIRVDATGKIFATRNGTVLGSSSTLALISGSGWHFIEMKATINSSAGAIEVWVDNVQYLNLSGLNTQVTVNAFANRIFFCNPLNSIGYWKDMYILDTSSGVNVTRLGDVTVGVSYASAAGVSSDWTNNGGSSPTNSVQDGITHTGTWPDGDATYISSATANQVSDFAHQALSLTGTIFGAIHATYARKDDSGSRVIKQTCLSGVATELGADINLGNSYQYYYDVLENDPNTSAPWTVTNLNNATFGVKEIS